jgi:hypothetical protein
MRALCTSLQERLPAVKDDEPDADDDDAKSWKDCAEKTLARLKDGSPRPDGQHPKKLAAYLVDLGCAAGAGTEIHCRGHF